MFIVIYLDDFNRKHWTVARDMVELRFFKDRFEVIEYTVIKK